MVEILSQRSEHLDLRNQSLLVALLGVLLFAAGCEVASPQAEAQGGPQGPMPVSVATPLQREVNEWDEYTGRFEAVEEVEVRARVSGYLTSVDFRDGQVVAQGDLLFRIDPRPFEASLAAARAEVEGAKARQELARLELARGQRLVRNNTISREAFDERQQNKLEADAAVIAAEAAVTAAELELEFTEIRSPIAGRISDNFVSVGNLISGGTANATLLTRIVSLDPIEFVFDVSEREHLKYLRLDRTGQRTGSREAPNPVYIRLSDEETFSHLGYMNFVDNRLDPNTGTMRGRALLDNPDGIFIPGLFGRLRLFGSGTYTAVMIPDALIQTDQTRKFVWVVNGDNQIEYRPVTLGNVIDGMRVVRTGLTTDDQVVAAGIQFVRPGMEVSPQTVSFEEAG